MMSSVSRGLTAVFRALDNMEDGLKAVGEDLGPETIKHIAIAKDLLKTVRVELWRIDSALLREGGIYEGM